MNQIFESRCDDFTNLLTKLCAAKGVSGQEQEVVSLIKTELEGRCDEVSVDHMGNIIAVKKGSGTAPTLLMVAHTDEVGAIINEVRDNGLLSFKTVGYVSEPALQAIRVMVGNCPGVIGAPPAHTAKPGDAVELIIDIGASSKEEVLSMGVNVGTPVTFLGELLKLGGYRVTSHAIDDRVGCAVLLSLLDKVNNPSGDVIFGFSVREETTMTGATMIANRTRPDCAIAIDTVPTDDIKSAGKFRIGAGPVMQLMEGVMKSYVGNAVHPGIKKALLSASEASENPVQLCAEVGGWTTDGHALHQAAEGIPTGYLSIPRRYAHSPAEVLDLRDPIAAVDILAELIEKMDKINLDFIQ